MRFAEVCETMSGDIQDDKYYMQDNFPKTPTTDSSYISDMQLLNRATTGWELLADAVKLNCLYFKWSDKLKSYGLFTDTKCNNPLYVAGDEVAYIINIIDTLLQNGSVAQEDIIPIVSLRNDILIANGAVVCKSVNCVSEVLFDITNPISKYIRRGIGACGEVEGVDSTVQEKLGSIRLMDEEPKFDTGNCLLSTMDEIKPHRVTGIVCFDEENIGLLVNNHRITDKWFVCVTFNNPVSNPIMKYVPDPIEFSKCIIYSIIKNLDMAFGYGEDVHIRQAGHVHSCDEISDYIAGYKYD